MKTKLDILKDAFNAGDHAKAIRIAAKFPDLGKERAAILDAHTAITNPRWTTGLGKSVDAAIAGGVAALRIRYSI
jgi:hypothetical protein